MKMPEIVAAPSPAPAGVSLVSALVPRTFEEALRFCDVLAKSTLVPPDYQGKPANILVALQHGLELGISPLQAMRSIAVIDGRPLVYGSMVLGLVRASGLLVSIDETIQTDAAGMTAVCTVVRAGDPKPVTRTFSEADARRAGLADKANYKKYPVRMLQARARGYALNDVFPDVLNGLGTRDDFGPVIDVEPVVPQPPTRPQPQEAVIDAEPVESGVPPSAEPGALFVKAIEESESRAQLKDAAEAVIAAKFKSPAVTRAYQKKDAELASRGL